MVTMTMAVRQWRGAQRYTTACVPKPTSTRSPCGACTCPGACSFMVTVALDIVSVLERADAGTCSWIPALLLSVRACACTLALALDDGCCAVALLALALPLALALALALPLAPCACHFCLLLRLLLRLLSALALALALQLSLALALARCLLRYGARSSCFLQTGCCSKRHTAHLTPPARHETFP